MPAATDVPVTEVGTRVYTVPTDAPEGDGTLTWDSTTMVLVRLTGGGHTGIGWTYGPPAAAEVIRGELAELVRGRSCLDVQSGYHAMVAAVRNAGRPGLVSLAIAAVDTAWWDLRARVLGLPLHRLLGAERTAPVRVYGSGGFTTYDDNQLARQCEEWLELGVSYAKIKIGESWGANPARDLARMRLARQALGEDVELFVDANGAFTPKQATRLAATAEDLGVTWFEEPVTSDDLDGLRRVRDHVRPDVTAGEYGYDLTYFERMCAAGAVDCLQVDVSRCGGITEWQRIAAVAAAHHLPVSAHCAPALHLAAAAATPHLRHVEYFHDHVRIESRFFAGPVTAHDGALHPGDDPGNGLEFRESDAESYRVG
ncbi:L-alanine-DL-glutamate epimerase [Actinopolymorpha cephalotaxi]|uniref:L-alanine-DL-glutamate epimerase n=1 Tax=Actinopolymorpha cephalotaxi TaxID=504797 RepID=A0A1I3AZZ6_9ACTN|nr:enolase C-terminal domain-like protein [Actinopolymorpha cephalotaxi]NYH84267.1 L-alanine-DL-glutamate epimerase-like enolase superfamily enzyme [Actinopolymorpha cephalotaxi]SFH55613.1 L-alanine-DL-glutamate epimerase [Actinopolymorpha cephalotaxi]